MNQSKSNDPRFWKKWRDSGAVEGYVDAVFRLNNIKFRTVQYVASSEDKDRISLEKNLEKIEYVAKRLSDKTYSAPTRHGGYVRVTDERGGLEVLKELQSKELSKQDWKLVKGGYNSGFNDVERFVKWSAEPQIPVYIWCFNRIVRKIEGTQGSVPEYDPKSRKWKETPVIRRYPIEFHFSTGKHDSEAEQDVRRILKQSDASPVNSSDVRKFCAGYKIGTLEKIEDALKCGADLTTSYASLGDVLYAMHTGKGL